MRLKLLNLTESGEILDSGVSRLTKDSLEERLELRFSDFIPITGVAKFFYRYLTDNEPTQRMDRVVANTFVMTAYHGVVH